MCVHKTRVSGSAKEVAKVLENTIARVTGTRGLDVVHGRRTSAWPTRILGVTDPSTFDLTEGCTGP
jgi:hypothetical protein